MKSNQFACCGGFSFLSAPWLGALRAAAVTMLLLVLPLGSGAKSIDKLGAPPLPLSGDELHSNFAA